MITKTEDIDALESRLLRPGVAIVELPAAFLAGMIRDLREAKRAQADFYRLRDRSGGEEDVTWQTTA